jgi:hypothetical protein
MGASATPSTRNVLRIYRAATADELAAGREWYARAQRLAAELDEDVDRAAGVIAVLSPQTSWPLNVRLARRAYELRDAGASVEEIVAGLRGCTHANGRKAAMILWGADPDAVVSGPKVRAFWHTIARPGDARSVVVDRHAYDVAVGRVTDDTTRGRALGRVGGYAAVADTYLRAAKILRRQGQDVTAADVQAVTWTVWRAHHIRANHGDVAA